LVELKASLEKLPGPERREQLERELEKQQGGLK
jgi:hypothetical protein